MPVNAGHRRADDDDDAQVSTFVTTSTFTTKDHGKTSVTDTVFTTEVTVTDSSTKDSKSSSTASDKSSSTSSSTGKSSSTSSGSATSSSSSAASTSASTSSTSSGASVTGLSTSASASSFATLPSNTASATTSAGAKPTSSNTSSIANSSSSKSLSTGAIVGISAGGGALLLLILIYFVRKRFLHRRERRLDNYILPDTGFGNAEKGAAGGGISVDTLVPDREPSIRKEPLGTAAAAPPPMLSYANSQSSRQQYPVAGGSGPAPGQVMPPGGIAPGQVVPPVGAPRAAVAARGYNGAAPQMAGYNDPPVAMFQNQAPAARYNTPPPAAPYANYGAPARTASPALSGYAASAAAAAAPARTGSPAIPASLTPSHGSSGSVSFALVRNAFLPNLPDELAVGQGEMVRVLAEYDDGWALCQNMRGEQGAVPLECLQRQRVNVPGAGGTRTREDQLAFVPPA